MICFVLSLFYGTLSAQESAKQENEKLLVHPLEDEKKDSFNLSYYEPMYILFGKTTSKLKLSFKYKFFRETPIYFGYVQNIFWLFLEESHPIKDTNFNPRIFYRLQLHANDGEDYLDIIAFEHKSNGVAQFASRSYDSFGAKLGWRFENQNWSLKPYFKALIRYNLDEPNSDYAKYVGPFESGLAVSSFLWERLDRSELSYRFYSGGDWGEDFSKMSHEVGFSFRLFGNHLTPSLYLQYFNGYAESLLDYKKREDVIRFGLLL